MGLEVYATKCGKRVQLDEQLRINDLVLCTAFEEASRCIISTVGQVDGGVEMASLDCNQSRYALFSGIGHMFASLTPTQVATLVWNEVDVDEKYELWAVASARHFLQVCQRFELGMRVE